LSEECRHVLRLVRYEGDVAVYRCIHCGKEFRRARL